MGGNLFKLGRLPKADYLRLESKVMTYLDEKLPNAYRIPRYYANKADFGDMDIILCAEELPTAWTIFRLEIAKELGITQYQMSGQLFSTVLEGFQVDFFLRPRANFETTYHYLSFNDIGNLIGKIFKRFNLKYGEVGLEYVFRRAEGSYKKDILISKDFQQIYAFLGLDYENDVFTVEIKNVGETFLRCNSYVEFTSLSTGQTQRVATKGFTILPTGHRYKSFDVPKDLPPGRYSVLAVLDYGNRDEVEAAEMEIMVPEKGNDDN